jgi:hypothetical protein
VAAKREAIEKGKEAEVEREAEAAAILVEEENKT